MHPSQVEINGESAQGVHWAESRTSERCCRSRVDQIGSGGL